MRTFVGVSSVFALVLFSDYGSAGGKAVRNQMVRGNVKVVDVAKDLLIVNQKVKSQFVDRELSILDSTEFVIISPQGKKEAVGKGALQLLEGKEGSPVAIKCDRDVNVLRVTVTVKK